MLADILPTGYEVGVLNGRVAPGDVVAVVGAGPIGLATIMGARLFSPSRIIAVDLADSRLAAAKEFGADVLVNNAREDPAAIVRDLTGGLGADAAVEAVGVPDAGRFVTHRFGLDDFPKAYEVFADAAHTGALKVVLTR